MKHFDLSYADNIRVEGVNPQDLSALSISKAIENVINVVLIG